MTVYLSNRDGDGKTSEEGHYKFQTAVWAGNVLGTTALQVTQNSPLGMSVIIAAGQFKIDTSGDYSYTGWNTSNYVQAITTADPANPRITTIVVYVDKGAATSPSPPNNPGIVKFLAVNGTPAGSPTAPSAGTIQTAVGASNPYVILANVTVGTGVTQITNANISDQRTQVTVGTNLVTSASIQDLAITTGKLADLSVTTGKLADLSVTTAKLADASIDDSKWRNTVAFSAYRSSTLNFAAQTFTKLSCNTIEYNYGNAYSNTSNIGRFTAPYTGVYMFNISLNSAAAGNTRAIIELRVNGSATNARTSDHTETTLRVSSGSYFRFLNAGDYAEAWAWTNVATNVVSSGTQPTQFGGALVTRT